MPRTPLRPPPTPSQTSWEAQISAAIESRPPTEPTPERTTTPIRDTPEHVRTPTQNIGARTVTANYASSSDPSRLQKTAHCEIFFEDELPEFTNNPVSFTAPNFVKRPASLRPDEPRVTTPSNFALRSETREKQDVRGDEQILFEDEVIIGGEIVSTQNQPRRTHVRMIRHGANPAQNTGFTSVMSSIWQSIRAPTFNGAVGEWMDFSAKWSRYLRLVENITGQIPADDLRLEILTTCLDPDNKSIVESKISQGQTYTQVWQDLERRYTRDDVGVYRAHWRSLMMPLDGLNEDSLRWFATEWEKRRARVEDATEEEAHELFLNRVGPYWAKKIYQEEAKKMRNKFGIRISRFGDFSLVSVENLVTRVAGENPVEFREQNGWYNVIVSSEEAQQRLLDLKGRKIVGGSEFKVLRNEPKMSVKEILAWMSDDVKINDKVDALGYQNRVNYRAPSPVREVVVKDSKTTTKQTSTPPSPKGGGSPRPKTDQDKMVQFSDKERPTTPSRDTNTQKREEPKEHVDYKPQGKGKGKGKGKGGKGWQDRPWQEPQRPSHPDWGSNQNWGQPPTVPSQVQWGSQLQSGQPLWQNPPTTYNPNFWAYSQNSSPQSSFNPPYPPQSYLDVAQGKGKGNPKG